jgi:hypothetical protein
MRRFIGVLAVVSSLFIACGNDVTIEDGSGGASAAAGQTSATGKGSESTGSTGTPCSFLHGMATLTSWDGEDEHYAASTYSFEFASNDVDVTYNDIDVEYQGNSFYVNTVTDDQSFIVDLGDVALADVPPTVDPDDYPLGEFGMHDAVGAVLDHTFMVRTIDGNTKQWAAFRVVGLEPGESVTIAWERSTDPDQLSIPTQCGV